MDTIIPYHVLLLCAFLFTAPPPSPTDGFIAAGKLQVHYEVHGTGSPLVFVHAGDQDVPYIFAVATWLHANIKNSKKIVIPHTAHMLNMENPALFNKTVHSFLQE